MAKRIVLATIGSLGDLHPFLAVGQALRARGASVLLAVPDSYATKTRAAGFETCVILPSYENLGVALGVTPEEASRKIMWSPDFLFRHVMLPALPESVRVLDEAAAGADMIVGSMFATCAALVAEKRAIPYAPVLLQPLAFISPRDPPRTADFFAMARYPARGLALNWNRLCRRLVHAELNRRYGPAIDRVRAAHGMGPSDMAPGFESEVQPALQLALYPRLLGPDDDEVTRGAVFTGYTRYDSESGLEPSLDAEAAAFLDAGEPPIVFTLGTLAVHAPGRFYAEARRASAALGRRAIMLGEPAGVGSDDQILSRPYLPYSLVFPRCAAVVHQGGIGTTGQALMAGRPQIVVPHMADQADNGARVVRLGCGWALKVGRFRAARVAEMLQGLLADENIRARAGGVAGQIGGDDGGRLAADAILTVLEKRAR